MKSKEPNEYKSSIIINTYKSIWLQSMISGNYKRIQKSRYPLEFLVFNNCQKLPKIRAVLKLLGRKEQGVDFYKYYSDIIVKGERGKWQNEFTRVKSQIESLGYTLDETTILDISGEPGFFAQDATEVCKSVEVTAFDQEVSLKMKNILGLSANKFDFQIDDLTNLFDNGVYDFIFVRYAIGFCEKLIPFVNQCHKLLKNGGIVYISFSPASRGVCARWMFDDYTYLRQFTTDYLVKSFTDSGLSKVGDFDEGSYLWDKNLHPVQKMLSKIYINDIFADCDSNELYQHNQAIIFKKK